MKELFVKQRNLHLSDYSLILIVFLSIFYMKLVPIGFFLLILSFWINRREKSELILDKNGKIIFVLFGSYYGLLLLGMLWTDNIPFGFSKLENKLSFLLFPFIYLMTKFSISKNHFFSIIIFSLASTLLLYEIVGLYRHFLVGHVYPWYYLKESPFCLFIHRSYFACYLVIGTMICLNRWIQNDNKYLYSFLFIFFSFGVFQTLSKAGIICYLFFIPTFLIVELVKLKNYKTIGALSILIVLFGFYIFFSNSLIAIRFRKIPEVFENVKLNNNPSTESNISRLLMWNASLEVIKENPILGTGTGDYDDELTKMSKSIGNSGVAEKRYNSHNQFLNTFVQLGIIGLFILCGIFCFSFVSTIKTNNWLAFFTFSIFFVNFLFESFLETQAGIVLFCVFAVVLNSNNLRNNKNIETLHP